MLVLPPVCRKSKSIVLLLAITAIAAAGLFAGLFAGQARAEDHNQPPAIAEPSNTSIKYLFPKDTAGKITVKDVGPPAPATGLTLTPQQNNNAKFNITWDTPIANQFLEGTQRVEFPHESFNVTNVRVDFQPEVESIPTTDSTKTSTFLSSTTGIQNIQGVAGQEYTLINSEGDSQPVTKTIQLTGPANRPEPPIVTATGPTWLKLSWTEPETNGIPIDGYALQTAKKVIGPWTYWNLGGNTDTTATITTLEPNTNYQVNLRAHINNAGGHWSKPTPAKTDAFNPAISILLPTARQTKLTFDGPIAGDPDGTGATYVFKFKKPGETESLTPAEVHLSVEGPDDDNDFTIKAADDTTLDQFRTLFGDSKNSITLKGTLTATNTISYSTDLKFNLTLTYDDSAQFDTPAVHQSQNRWIVPDTYYTYEGSTSLPGISVPWTGLTSGAREWQAGTRELVTFKCTDQSGDTFTDTSAEWPPDGDKDSSLFTATSATAAQSGNVTVAFQNPPDYENPTDDEGSKTVGETEQKNPGDNTYHLRITSDHNLHDSGTEGSKNIGCDGSALDVTITVKNVGPPEQPEFTTADFDTNDKTKIDLTWSKPTTFVENGQSTTFPNTEVQVSKYQYHYKSGSAQAWSETEETTSTSVTITGLDKTGYIVQVRAVNSEGNSEWTETTIGTIENQAPTITAPTNHDEDIWYKFPDGKLAVIKYDQEPGSDPEGNTLSYRFRVKLPDTTGLSTPTDALLTFTRNGNNFEIEASGEVTPAEFSAVYGTDQQKEITVSIYSSDGTLESEPQTFNITVYYEASAYFDDADERTADERTADQRFTFTEPFKTYEGPAAGEDITINWSAHMAGSRSWGAGNPAGGIGCRDNANTVTPHTWLATGAEDSALFAAPTASTTGNSGTINPTFTNAPDFKNDGDNTYLVRFYNTHNLHNPSPQSTIPSCSGSAIDLQIKVKDVGTPAPVTLTGVGMG